MGIRISLRTAERSETRARQAPDTEGRDEQCDSRKSSA
jgi:hypothetical protein